MAKDLAQTQLDAVQLKKDHVTQEHLFAPDVQIMLLTWVTFFGLLAVLSKFAWKPILQILDEREQKLRRAIEEAERTQEEYGQIESKRQHILAQADQQAKEHLKQSRDAAAQAAKLIEERAKDHTEIMLQNAQREIESLEEKSAAYLQEQSAQTAVELARKIIAQSLDSKKHREIVDKLIEDI